MSNDTWAGLVDRFAGDAYATVKGHVRTHLIHAHLAEHLPPPPAGILDVGGGAGHQSLPLARAGYDVTLLDPSSAMLAKAEERLAAEPPEVRARVRLVEAPGERAAEATGGRKFAGVLCHGVLLYMDDPEPLIAQLCACAAPDGVVSVMTLNAATMAVRPALEQRWTDALAAFDAHTERGPLGLDTRADTVESLSGRFRAHGAEPLAWYGVCLFTDWSDPAEPTPETLEQITAVELRASRQDPYRSLCRAFHLLARRTTTPSGPSR